MEFIIDNINKTVCFKFSYDEEKSKELKNMHFNSRWNGEFKHWVVPVDDWSKNLILDFIRKYSFKQKIIDKEEDVNVSYEKTDVDYAYLRGLCDAKDFSYTPRKYQLEALAYGLDKGNIINGDSVGLGKTFESIMYTETTNSFPCLVIVPASVKYNWEEKWKEITKNKRNVSVIESKKDNDWNADVVVINYDIIGKKQGTGATVRFEELLTTEWKMIILDEAHFLKSSTSIRSKAAKKIAKENMIIQMLSGTVTMNKPIELWNLLVISRTDHFIADDWMHFITRYCGGYRGKFGWVTDGATNILELNRKLRENCYIRREKRDVLEDMPPITKQVIHVPISNKKKYDLAISDFIKFVIEEKGEDAAERAMEAEALVALGMLRKLSIEGKLKAIEQYLKDWQTADNGKLLVFGLHREQLDYLSNKFKCDLIAGGTSSKDKLRIVKKWQKDDNIFLFGNMQSAGTGIDGLQNVCSNMLILELPWRPSDITQAIGRLDRFGQKLPVTVTFTLSDYNIDEDMWQMLIDKEYITEAVNKGIDINRNKSGMKMVLKKILKKISK